MPEKEGEERKGGDGERGRDEKVGQEGKRIERWMGVERRWTGV